MIKHNTLKSNNSGNHHPRMTDCTLKKGAKMDGVVWMCGFYFAGVKF